MTRGERLYPKKLLFTIGCAGPVIISLSGGMSCVGVPLETIRNRRSSLFSHIGLHLLFRKCLDSVNKTHQRKKSRGTWEGFPHSLIMFSRRVFPYNSLSRFVENAESDRFHLETIDSWIIRTELCSTLSPHASHT